MNSPNPKPTFNKTEWRATYSVLAETLERIRTQEIAALTDKEALRQIESLSAASPPWRERPDWSGLVEQQALFHPRKKP